MHKLLMTLRYYATGSIFITCADFPGIQRTTAEEIIHEVSDALARLASAFIDFPTTDDRITKIQLEFYSVGRLPSCIGALGCTHIKIKSPGDHNTGKFRNRRKFFSINVQTVCDAQLRIQNIVAKWPGGSKDKDIFQASDIKQRFENNEFKDCVLIAGAGYTPLSYLITRMPQPTAFVDSIFNESLNFTLKHTSKLYSNWKNRFPVLSLGIGVKDLDKIQAIIMATAVLHNIADQFEDDHPKITDKQRVLIKKTLFDQRPKVPKKRPFVDHIIHIKQYIDLFARRF